MMLLLALLIAQIALGALIIWTGRHPEIATAHQATGAALLATAVLITFRLYLCRPDSTSTSSGLQSSNGLVFDNRASLKGAGA